MNNQYIYILMPNCTFNFCLYDKGKYSKRKTLLLKYLSSVDRLYSYFYQYELN